MFERARQPPVALLVAWAVAALVTIGAVIASSPAAAQTPGGASPSIPSETPRDTPSPGSTPAALPESPSPSPPALLDPGSDEERGRFDRWVRPLAVISILLVAIAGLYVYLVIRKGL